MKYRGVLLAMCMLAAVGCGSRGGAPGRPRAGSQVIPPNMVMDFDVLYASNCAGCHGENGKGGAAIGLADPVYLAIVEDATIRRVASDGVAGTVMAAFAQRSGGMLTDRQIDVIVSGIRTRWGRPGILQGVAVPPYAVQTPGDPKRGATVYATYCSSCHGPTGGGGTRGSSIIDGSFLALVSDQNLRTTVIAGRPELGAPDWRGDVPGKPMSADEVSDVVAWLASQRAQFPGQPYTSEVRPEGGVR